MIPVVYCHLASTRKAVSNFTRCCRFERKDANDFMTEPGMPSSVSLFMTTVWSTRSNAFEKSTNKTSAETETGPELSATGTWVVVGRPCSAPNCFWSDLDSTWFTIQLPTYDSSSLVDRVGVKEIGRISVAMFPGGCTFGTGTSSRLIPKALII